MKTSKSSEQGIRRLAVIGCGNLGSALVRGFVAHLAGKECEIVACDTDAEKLAALKRELQVTIAPTPTEAVENADVIVIAVKPGLVSSVVSSLRSSWDRSSEAPLIVSVAGGVPLAVIRQAAGTKPRLARVIPNLACTVGFGVSSVYAENSQDTEVVQKLFRTVGTTMVLRSEFEIDVATALGASAPAFIFLIIEALADGGVRLGLTRENALEMAAQMVLGSAKLVQECRYHPAQLKDMVASPGGTTIAGLHVLESAGVRGAIISAVKASADRAFEIRDVAARSGVK